MKANWWIESDVGCVRIRTVDEVAEVTELMVQWNGARWVRWVARPKGWTVPRAGDEW